MVTLCLKYTAKTGNDVSRFTRSRKVVIRQSKCGLKVLQNRHRIHWKLLLSEKGIIQFSHVFTTCSSAFYFSSLWLALNKNEATISSPRCTWYRMLILFLLYFLRLSFNLVWNFISFCLFFSLYPLVKTFRRSLVCCCLE